jgi:hypothetical protein
MNARVDALVILRVFGEWKLYDRRVWEVGRGTDEFVLLHHTPRLERSREGLESILGTRSDDKPRGARVEAVKQPWLAGAMTNAGEFGVAADECVGECAYLAGAERSSGLARRLVNDNDERRFVGNHEGGVRRGDRGSVPLRLAVGRDREELPCRHTGTLGANSDANGPFLDSPLHLRTRQTCHQRKRRLVETDPIEALGYLELLGRHQV